MQHSTVSNKPTTPTAAAPKPATPKTTTATAAQPQGNTSDVSALRAEIADLKKTILDIQGPQTFEEFQQQFNSIEGHEAKSDYWERWSGKFFGNR